MRKEFSIAVENLMDADPKVIFMTGDLGYNALENLQNKFPNRFINTGVAEQNMVGMAAGLAYKGFKVFCYSIAPFVVYRCLEQFRNDVCLHNLPVFLVGNGGGYGYGIMGSSHHAIEDIACLSSLQNVTCWTPGFNDEVNDVLLQMVANSTPAYLRLGVGGLKPVFQNYGSFDLLNDSTIQQTVVFALGPIITNVLKAIESSPNKNNISVFSCHSLPFTIPTDFFLNFDSNTKVLVVEEHVSIGGLAQQLGLKFLENGILPAKFVSLRAAGYPDGTYGSQAFHQAQSGLSVEQISQKLLTFFE